MAQSDISSNPAPPLIETDRIEGAAVYDANGKQIGTVPICFPFASYTAAPSMRSVSIRGGAGFDEISLCAIVISSHFTSPQGLTCDDHPVQATVQTCRSVRPRASERR